jgi:S-disulfanyl-L-cysteine oxidoreductase SoxD
VIRSFLPDYARNAHGNLAEQFRLVGPVRGADTTRPPSQGGAALDAARPAPVTLAAAQKPKTAPDGASGSIVQASSENTASLMPLLQKNTCTACHGVDSRLVGPAFREIAAKYKTQPDAVNYLSGKIRSGGQGAWGAIPMPAQSLSADDASRIARWLAQGAPK